ncbi:ATP synthase epsilon subunit [Metamycoplasma arthritidis]|uniref:ATP synthase epsilon subunit n=1 Tax=Metamycoplasma arthritidis (strain 158L3-1) TaxID=243272 RepID=B3PLV9_META1|nr:hypothetical protein [Metamycoplasma arthritidis]ACF07011.1 ATP synthase epsilon subunit [Metamycoplasma arthritidis 158L3-1]VEU78539.1 ATP synthase epsilon subunit [Metamycoplasma arthritidis]
MKLINLLISTPNGNFLDSQAEIVTFQSTEGQMGIMAGATEFMCAIVPSQLFINHENSENRQVYYVDKGILHFKDDKLSLIVNQIDKKPLEINEIAKTAEFNKYSMIEEILIKRKILENK